MQTHTQEVQAAMAELRLPLVRPRGRRFERLAVWSYRRRWRALAAWVVVLAGVTVASQLVGDDYRNDFSLPGTESQRAVDTLKEHAPAQAGSTVQIVLHHPGGIRTQQTQQRVEAMLEGVRRLPHVADVVGPYADVSAVSPDGTIAYATVALDGDAIRAAQESQGGGAEGAGLLVALVILVVLFGSLLAASLPILIAIFAVGSTIGLIALASHAATVADFTPPLMLLVGLGVGIDYALLVFSRYRAELLGGAEREPAVRTALDTAGRTVFLAALTVIIALGGLVVLGLGALQGMAVALALTVLVTMLASLTLLPAPP